MLNPQRIMLPESTTSYLAYRDINEVISILIEADPKTLQLTDELCEKNIEVLHKTVVNVWAKIMRRCRVEPVRELVKVLKAFSEKGSDAMAYLVSRKKYLQHLYDQVYHIKYESCDHVLIEEVFKIIRPEDLKVQPNDPNGRKSVF